MNGSGAALGGAVAVMSVHSTILDRFTLRKHAKQNFIICSFSSGVRSNMLRCDVDWR